MIPWILAGLAVFFALAAVAVLRSLSTERYPRRVVIDITLKAAIGDLLAYTAVATFLLAVALKW